jgi:hypothetical protein
MLKPNELRIGNKIYALKECPDVVEVTDIGDDGNIGTTAYFAFGAGCTGSTSEIACGIQITPEWLKLCGFEKVSELDWDGPIIEHENETEYFGIRKCSDGMYRLMGSEWPTGKPFRYVHQLQNLFYCHAEEELTIKETV